MCLGEVEHLFNIPRWVKTATITVGTEKRKGARLIRVMSFSVNSPHRGCYTYTTRPRIKTPQNMLTRPVSKVLAKLEPALAKPRTIVAFYVSMEAGEGYVG